MDSLLHINNSKSSSMQLFNANRVCICFVTVVLSPIDCFSLCVKWCRGFFLFPDLRFASQSSFIFVISRMNYCDFSKVLWTMCSYFGCMSVQFCRIERYIGRRRFRSSIFFLTVHWPGLQLH